ncbi:DUF4143 domain-containing protein [Thermophilibacter immobilis]|uniref:DUF4143 domain-containing protein n=2 Tax=Thermophilibacter immobilis TaxID=2779519 RepID=A0A7S7M7M4_9ACTN|nr:DUF4143 domain-containing protein [Thermophilibacter immobilis]
MGCALFPLLDPLEASILWQRVCHLRLFESDDAKGGVSFASLFDGAPIQGVRRGTEIADVARWCCRGGWPSIMGLEDEFALETPADYIRSVNEVNVPKLGKDSATSLALMRSLAFDTSQAVTYATLAVDMGEDGSPARTRGTASAYLQMLSDLYLTEDLGGWEPPLRAKRRVRVRPKRYLIDPSLPAALIGASPSTLLRDTQTLGGLFETLCLRDLRVYLSVMPGAANKICYYRDEKDLEVDFVIELSDGRWGALEVKLSDLKVDDAAAERLLAFKRKVTANARAQARQPEFLAFLVGRGDFAYRRDDGILIIPIAALEP